MNTKIFSALIAVGLMTSFSSSLVASGMSGLEEEEYETPPPSPRTVEEIKEIAEENDVVFKRLATQLMMSTMKENLMKQQKRQSKTNTTTISKTQKK